MPPISYQELIDLVRPIVESELPDELLAFDLNAAEMKDEFSRKRRPTASENPETFGFLPAKEAADVLDCVRLLSGTLAFITAVMQLKKQHKSDPPHFKEQLAAYLRKAGLSEHKALQIAEKFHRQIISYIRGRIG